MPARVRPLRAGHTADEGAVSFLPTSSTITAQHTVITKVYLHVGKTCDRSKVSESYVSRPLPAPERGEGGMVRRSDGIPPPSRPFITSHPISSPPSTVPQSSMIRFTASCCSAHPSSKPSHGDEILVGDGPRKAWLIGFRMCPGGIFL
ncbi:hypothetical protein QC762_117755 [Podospora pseudocomata]|uniref:Uncharacterized protein n=1 Tax=Podospora pseudocomata TaxID=2093779 RepID=A0ABR0GX27_9PEZI|nr:hypothetical protein QC762_117755 [Podospora pseudocomata]